MHNRWAATGVITAMPAEARTARALESPSCQVSVAGVGADNASKCAQTLVEQGAQHLLLWGVAGALQPALRPGDILIPRVVLAAEGGEYPVTMEWQRQLHDAVPPDIQTSQSALVTTGKPVSGRQAKSALAQQTGAAAADMEAAAVAHVAQAHGADFAMVRAVVDPLEQALPEAVLQVGTGSGFARNVVRGLVTRPSDVPRAAMLGINMRRAQRSLSAVAKQLYQP